MQHDASLQIYPLNQELKNWLFSEFWKSCHTTTQLWNECSYCCPPVHQTPVSTALETLDRKSPYFDYYCTKCHFEACVLDPGFVLVQRHSHLLDVARQMLKDRTRDEVKSYILAKYPINPNAFPGDKAVETTVNLCGSLLLMTEIGSERAVIAQFLQRPLLWNGSQTLREAVRAHFQPRKHLQPGIATLGRFFSARNIQQIGGISIKWTCNLADHLLLKDDDQTLFVFHCASFLEHHKRLVHPAYHVLCREQRDNKFTYRGCQADRSSPKLRQSNLPRRPGRRNAPNPQVAPSTIGQEEQTLARAPDCQLQTTPTRPLSSPAGTFSLSRTPDRELFLLARSASHP